MSDAQSVGLTEDGDDDFDSGRQCFQCDGDGIVCAKCREALSYCTCRDPGPTRDCPSCVGTGVL